MSERDGAPDGPDPADRAGPVGGEPVSGAEPGGGLEPGGGGEAGGASGPTSGLRNPGAAVRGVGAGALVAEGLVLLLAIRPMQVLGVHLTGLAITAIIVLAVVCLALAGLLRRAWAWWAGVVVQVALVVCGFVFHASLGVLGVVFGLLWAYVLRVRRSVLR
ncbi:DUF4233 domain-containing protein [Luedemannella helvata]|uniref:DUF4233 domain-containing protein n=1 Tax=Luedemannella helvata TaxID=349315 RepID=A0ABP4WLB2_9ACTN